MWQTWTNTPSLPTLNRVLGLPTDAKTSRQFELMDYPVIYLGSLSISAFFFSLISAMLETSGMNGTRRSFGSSMVSNSGCTGDRAHARDLRI